MPNPLLSVTDKIWRHNLPIAALKIAGIAILSGKSKTYSSPANWHTSCLLRDTENIFKPVSNIV
jgi:hypothetical protein